MNNAVLKKFETILILIYLFISTSTLNANAYDGDVLARNVEQKDSSVILADSIMKIVISNASRYQNLLESSETEIYIKGHTNILKRNRLLLFAHRVFPVNRRPQNAIFEMVSNSKFEPPNVFVHKIQAMNGSSIPNKQVQQEIINFLNLNVYASTAFNDAIIMPVAKKATKYYTFKVMDVQDTTGLKIYRIRFLPKQLSQKLISGDLYVVDKVWTIDKIDLSGRYDFADYNLVVSYGRGYNRFNLPETADLDIRYRLLGNVILNTYHSKFDYKSIIWSEKGPYRDTRLSVLDLTKYYRLSSDTVPIIVDSVFWHEKRDIPLTTEEKDLYAHITDKKLKEVSADTINTQYIDLTQKLTNTMRFNWRSTSLRYSGFLNPSQIGYSKTNGVTYRQRLRINKRFEDGKELYVRPEVGFLFGRKEFYFKVFEEWMYNPERMGGLSLLIGNGNQSYSSKMIDEIQKMDSINFAKLDLQYYRHYYIELKNRIEVSNGVQLMAGFTFNHRNPVKMSTKEEVGEDIAEKINKKYNDFTPSIGFSFTPQQYYRMDGKRKEYVYSYYPTISVEFARAIADIWGGDGDFSRTEVDIHQNISLGLLKRLNYHLSGGQYSKNTSIYFADFRYFTRRNFPDTWDDQIGGVFNLLRREWFNASDKYLQGHLMYESPFIFLPALSKKFGSRYVFSERLYFSQLWTPALPSYTEIGYGIGNHIFNIGAFVSFEKWEHKRFGVKFAFELFE